MSEEPKDPSGTPPKDPVDPPAEPKPEPKPDTVSYETHRKLLGEKKRLAEELEALRAADQQRKEKELKETDRYKELYEAKEQELAQYKTQLESVAAQRKEAKKLDAILKALPTQLPEKYWNMVDTSKIILDDSGEVDKNTVADYVDKFQKTYPEIVSVRSGNGSISDAPVVPGRLTLEEWEKLPKDQKYARAGEVVSS